MAKTYYLFISHSWSYGSDYDNLIGLLEQAKYFDFRDYSVPKDDPIHDAPKDSDLYDAIKRQMTPCPVVIIMAGKYATYSKWIKKEIKIAKTEFSSPKPILAVKPWATTQVSSVVKENADKIVGWNTSSIVSAIREISI